MPARASRARMFSFLNAPRRECLQCIGGLHAACLAPQLLHLLHSLNALLMRNENAIPNSQHTTPPHRIAPYKNANLPFLFLYASPSPSSFHCLVPSFSKMSEPQETVAPVVPSAEAPVAAAATTAAVEPDAPIATQILAADENV